MGATDLGIDFRKLVNRDNDNGFELACTNEIIVDGKRSSRGKGFAYELKQSGPGLTGWSWAESDLGWYVPARVGSLLGCRSLVSSVDGGG